VADWPHDTPWRQGHALSSESAAVLGLAHPEAAEDTIVVVISHDCDLAANVDAEPFIEVVVGRKIEVLDGNRTNSKSVRCLHLSCSRGETITLIEIEIHNRQQIKKALMAEYLPSPHILLTSHERSLLQSWLAARYNRPSFPNEFVRRLTDEARKAYRKLEKQLADSSSHILAALFDLDEGKPDKERQGSEDIYALSIYLVFSVEADPVEAKKVADHVASEIKKIFVEEFRKTGQWRGIELVSCEAISEEEITLRISRLIRRWNFDHISFRGGHPVINQ